MPENSTSFVMTNLQDSRQKIKKRLGNLYGLRTWVEYSFRQCKQELGWTDYRFLRLLPVPCSLLPDEFKKSIIL